MEHSSYYEAVLPKQHKVLGLKLRPFSIGHLILLNRIESPLMTGVDDGLPAFGHLAVAALICSNTYRAAVELLLNPDLDGAVAEWGETITGQRTFKGRLGLFYRPIDVDTEAKAFSEYIRDGSDCPCYSYDSKASQTINAPMVQIVRVVLMNKLGIADSEIMDRPWRLCLWDFLTLRALDGQIRFEDAVKLDEAQKAANEFAARLKEMRGNGKA